MGFLDIFNPYNDKQYTLEVNSENQTLRDSISQSDTVPDFSVPSDAKEYAKVNSLHGIFGIPYQFMSTVDARPESSMVGRKYAEKILGKSPILFLTPVKQVFMEDFGEDDRGTALNNLINGGGSLESISGSGKYYTTSLAYVDYYKTVNKMCSEVAYFLGIGEIEIGQIGSNSTVKIKNIDWSKSTNNAFKRYYAASKAIALYLDGNSVATLSDSFSNGTTESSLASTLNSYSEQSRELQFLLGPDSALASLKDSAGEFTEDIAGNIADITKGLTGRMLSNLATTGIDTIINGGKIIFPKIWGDSQYNRSYSLDIKLRSPDHDKISIFLNILVPYIHLLGIVLPRSLDSQNPNAFQSPLLVKAYCKGMFNIDMGMITDMSVSRGAECQWNDDGLPTQIDISIQIEDLYQSLMLTQFDSIGGGNPMDGVLTDNWDLVSNTGMLEFLANMSGLNVADIEIGVRQRLYVYLQSSDLARAPSTVGTIIDNKLQNLYMRMTKWLYPV